MDLRATSTTERMFAAYSMAAGVVWVGAGLSTWRGLTMVLFHTALAMLLAGWGRDRIPVPRPTGTARLLLPYGLWLGAWMEIGWLHRLRDLTPHDLQVRAVDRALCGGLPHAELSRLWPWPWLEDLMGAAYLSYYLLVLGPVAYLAWRRRERLAEHTLTLMAVYLLCFGTYLVWPVVGPRIFAATGADPPDPSGGGPQRIMAFLFRTGDAEGTAFPSSHCAASLAAALAAGRTCGARFGRFAVAWALLIAFATVYTGNHYATDALAGLVLAGVVFGLVSRFRPRSLPVTPPRAGPRLSARRLITANKEGKP